MSVTEVTQERSSFPSTRAGWLAIVLAVVLAVALGWWLLSVVIRLFRPSPRSFAVPRDEVGDFLSVFVPQSSPTAGRSKGPRCAEGAGKLIAAIPDLGGWVMHIFRIGDRPINAGWAAFPRSVRPTERSFRSDFATGPSWLDQGNSHFQRAENYLACSG